VPQVVVLQSFARRPALRRAWPTVEERAAQVTPPSDDRSPMAKAYGWAARIMVVSLEMVLPGLAGYWLDQRLGTLPLVMLLGFAVGGTAAMVHLLQMTRTADRRR
jgi:F0F1-type ATP synthase assembly protein I